jgi:hypothetical protein
MSDDASVVEPAPAAQPASPAAQAAPPPPSGQPRVRFDTSNLKSSYCNVCNATSTREEVVINFGINQTWDMQQRDLEVQLQHRIILSPHAAKRLYDLLGKLVQEHEARYGDLR